MMNSETGDPKQSIDSTENDQQSIDSTENDQQSIDGTEIDQQSIEESELDDNEIEAEAADSENTTVVLDETGVLTDNVGDVSVEINVEELIADIELHEDKDAHRKKEIRRRLEEVVEEQAFEDTYAIDLDKKPE